MSAVIKPCSYHLSLYFYIFSLISLPPCMKQPFSPSEPLCLNLPLFFLEATRIRHPALSPPSLALQTSGLSSREYDPCSHLIDFPPPREGDQARPELLLSSHTQRIDFSSFRRCLFFKCSSLRPFLGHPLELFLKTENRAVLYHVPFSSFSTGEI